MVVSDATVSLQLDDHLAHPEPHEELIHGHMMPDPPIVPPSPLTRGFAKGIVALCDVLEIPLDQHRMALLDRLGPPPPRARPETNPARPPGA